MIDLIYQNEASIRLSAFLGGFGLLALWEWATPNRAPTQIKLKRWLNNFSLVVCSTIIVRFILPMAVIAFAFLVEQNQWGMLNVIELPFWLKVLFAFILLDLAIYFQHTLFHVLPIMWRFHRVHHSDLDCDVTTGLRFHPVEIVVSILLKFLAVFVLGAPILAVIIFEVVLNLMSMFTHSNVYLNKKLDRVLRWFIVTPNMHLIHHSTLENETNSNFCFNLSLWDRIFGTYIAAPQAGILGMTVGLNRYRDSNKMNFKNLMVMPFNKAIRGYAINSRDTPNEEELSRISELVNQRTKSLQKANDELKQQKNTLDHHAIVSIADRQGNITYVNDKFCNISGYNREELLGKNHRILKSNTHPKEFYQNLWTTISQGNVWQGKVCNKKRDGSEYWVESTISPFLDSKGIPYQYVSIRTDITELLNAKIKAEEANQAKNIFLSSMSHEIRTPMNAILGFSELMKLDAKDEESKENCSHIINAANNLFFLINGVLDLSHIESGNLNLSISNHSLKNIIESCLSTIKPSVDKMSIHVDNKLNSLPDININVDEKLFKKIILNLLSNAVKYNKENGSLIINYSVENDEMLCLSITDTGKGLSLEQQKHIFHAFDRAGSENSNIPGSGLGLVIAKNLTAEMNGTIGFESMATEGSRFWIKIPIS